jgi:hypothetical protein
VGDIVYGLRTNTLPEVTARQDQLRESQAEEEEEEEEEEKGVRDAKRQEDLPTTPLKGWHYFLKGIYSRKCL